MISDKADWLAVAASISLTMGGVALVIFPWRTVFKKSSEPMGSKHGLLKNVQILLTKRKHGNIY